jgi:hypothetical protein
MTALVRPLLQPACPLPSMAFPERHEPQIDVRATAARREHERERASERRSVLDRRVGLPCTAPQARAVGSRLRARAPPRQDRRLRLRASRASRMPAHHERPPSHRLFLRARTPAGAPSVRSECEEPRARAGPPRSVDSDLQSPPLGVELSHSPVAHVLGSARRSAPDG